MKNLSILILSLSVVFVLTGCVPKKYQKDKTPVEEQTATLENQTNEKYEAYSAGAVPEGEKMVLFFHADWCPTCVNWEKALLDEIDTLPEGAKVFKVDYDKETELRAKYGITKQSAAVFIDENGKVRKTSMDPSVGALVDFFNKETPKEKVVVDPNKEKYASYSSERASGQKVALFFHADWCATCRKWESDLKESLSELPDSTRVLKVDYDGMKDLVKDYGVTKQSTVVFLDENGNVAKKLMDPAMEKVAEYFGAQVKVEKEETKAKEVEVEEKEEKVDEVVEEEGKSESKETEEKVEKEEVSENEDPISDDEKDLVVEEKEVEASAEPRYETYSAETVNDLKGKKYILNFSAAWCPNCRKIDSEITGLLDTFPEGTVILKTDYDEYTDLKKKYGVNKQTTFVMVSPDGSHKTKTAPSISDLKAFFN